MADSLDPDQDQHVGPDLGPNCLQRISAKVVTCKGRFKLFNMLQKTNNKCSDQTVQMFMLVYTFVLHL